MVTSQSELYGGVVVRVASKKRWRGRIRLTPHDTNQLTLGGFSVRVASRSTRSPFLVCNSYPN